VDLARALGISRGIIGPMSGVFSTADMLAADVEHSLVCAILAPLNVLTQATLATVTDALKAEGLRELEGERLPGDAVVLRFAANIRCLGQSSELTVPFDDTDFGSAARQSSRSARGLPG
jgi:N-methylhydantoinase A